MPPIRHIVWDWNGTLLDDVQASVNTINQLLASRSLPPTDIACYRERFGFPVRNYYTAIGFRLEQENWNQLARTYHDLYLADRSIRLHPEAADVLRSCHDAGLGMSVLSAAEQSILEQMLTAAGIKDRFAFIHGVDNLHGHSKAEAGRALIRRLPDPPAQVLFVGDTLHDHEVAAGLGCPCVLIAQGHQSHARLLTAGCPVLHNLSGLTGFLHAEGRILK